MSTKNDGKKFERLTKEIFEMLNENCAYTKVETNIKLKGKDGNRQIDVLLRSKVASLSILTIIECKDVNKVLDVTYVDALHSKMQDVNANKAVLVTRKGFSKTALQKAKRLGITLCTAMEGRAELWDVGFQVPIIIIEIIPKFFIPQFSAYLEAGTEISIKSNVMIDGIPIQHVFRERLMTKEINFDEIGKKQIWQLECSKNDCYFYDAQNNKISINELEINFQLEIGYYFGYLHDVEGARVLLNKTEDNKHILFKVEELFDYAKTLTKFHHENEIPKVDSICIKVVSMPEIKNEAEWLNVKNKETGENYFLKINTLGK